MCARGGSLDSDGAPTVANPFSAFSHPKGHSQFSKWMPAAGESRLGPSDFGLDLEFGSFR